MKRTLIDRIHDRLWMSISERLEIATMPASSDSIASADQSVSGTMDWPLACSALVSGAWTSDHFRRTRAVRQVVETVGPVDGRHYANCIKQIAPERLTDERVAAIDAWGKPIRWPGILLGTPHAFSPTTLRYLAQALWLRQQGFVKEGGTIVEIGVGYGGLAAMNAIVSNATTLMVDLEPVAKAAMRTMEELGLGHYASTDHTIANKGELCLISNYAFTELSRSAQDVYADQFFRHADRGVILSNATVFARHMHGRDNPQIIELLSKHGINAKIDTQNTILCDSDRYHGNALVLWKRD